MYKQIMSQQEREVDTEKGGGLEILHFRGY